MTAVMRFLFALLLGMVIGAGATVYLIQSDAGDLLVRRTEVVQDLQRRLEGAEAQRNQLSKDLEAVVSRSERMEQAFGDLERRFRALDEARAAPPTAAPEARTPPPTP